MAGPAGDKSLQETPTWAVAAVCAIFVIISVLIEHTIHSLGKWFQRKNKKDLGEALEKIKAELMLLGFISLLLTVGTRSILMICIPSTWGSKMLPCKPDKHTDSNSNGRRKLLSLGGDVIWHRMLAAAPGGDDYCGKKGKIQLISQKGVHQLHIFLFVLALFHVLYSVITMVLGQAKMNIWKSWEKETSSWEYQFTQDPERFRFARQTSFVKRHSGLSTAPVMRWIVAFFRQFFGSVTKVDYMTMRHGFINAHLAPNSKFDFHKYIKRCMEDDFKVVVGISIPLWLFAVTYLLLNVYKWYTLEWLTLVPLIILLLVGMKLELVIMEMAQEIHERNHVVRGAPVVQPSNKFFWFNRPEWILLLIHYTLFQNAYQMAFFLWTWREFGLKPCFHGNLPLIVCRVVLGVITQFICSYITFPLYSLVTQMGSHMKRGIFEDQTTKALLKWQKAAKERSKKKKANDGSTSPGPAGFMLSGESTPNHGTSPMHLLHSHKYGSSQDIEGSPVAYPSENEISDPEGSSHGPGKKQGHQEVQCTDFSFEKA